MIDFLTLVIVGVALFQPTTERRVIALIYALFTFTHNFFLQSLDGFMYYATDASFYFLVVLGISLMNKPSYFAIEIQKIAIVAVALDYFGWLIYMLYIPPAGYDAAFMALYAWSIIVLLRGDKEDARDNPVGVRVGVFLTPPNSVRSVHNGQQETQ